MSIYKFIKIKLTALLIFSGVIFNSFSFLFVLENNDIYLETRASQSFNAVMASGNPLDVINDLMKKKQNDKPEKADNQKNDTQDFADRAFGVHAALVPVFVLSAIQSFSCNFVFAYTNAGIRIFSQALFVRIRHGCTGVLCLFAFLLMYLALLRDAFNINLSLLNKNAAA
ncbi:MAG: hypothetical protein LBL00_02695 [Endomicrobium sp.]|jgi:hypothetical protein|nr:hypothetical protein [Endomicrobium sp.]